MEQGIRYGSPDSRPYIMPLERSINVDNLLDFKLAEIILAESPRDYIQPVQQGNA
jgi:CMP-N-acetylneuraminic acid synthetase